MQLLHEIEKDLVNHLNLLDSMRMLFNHGLTIEELYSNTPKKIIDRKWRWFIKYYGSTSSYEDAISDPFKYCWVVLVNKIIDEKVRFKIPVKNEAYIDFEIVDEEKFVQHKQSGRFPEIDFIMSDFRGYALRYYFKAKAYQKSNQLYLGGDLKKKFLSKINAGENFYSIKDIILDDFIDQIYEKFPELTKSEVRNLILHGFRRLHSSIKFGCSITINTTKYGNCYIHIGSLTLDIKKQVAEYNKRRDKKLRKIEAWKKLPFDGYYYIGLCPSLFESWLELNKTSRILVKFQKVFPRKIMQELFYKHNEIYIFRITLKKFKGWLFWAEEISNRNTVYIGKVKNLVFTPSDQTWKELIKEYEKRNS
jgi:hypothetical protein